MPSNKCGHLSMNKSLLLLFNTDYHKLTNFNKNAGWIKEIDIPNDPVWLLKSFVQDETLAFLLQSNYVLLIHKI